MNVNEMITAGVNATMYALISIQDNPVFQTIQLVLAILTSVVLLAYRLWRWYKDAKKDGKIDKEEIDEAINIIGNSVEEIDSKNKKEGDKK